MNSTGNRHSPPVKVFSSFIQADVITAKMILQQEEIEYFTKNESVASVYPIPGLGNVDFFVDENDAKKAREVLAPLIEGENNG
jgi:hypothetical protein